mgnify:CR=1 FL=1
MLIPKRTKYRKQFRGRMKGRAHPVSYTHLTLPTNSRV